MKYVMFERPDGIIFPMVTYDLIGHDFIASCVASQYPGIKPISAGFCSVDTSTGESVVSIWGQSVTLKLKCNPSDAWHLKKMFDREY